MRQPVDAGRIEEFLKALGSKFRRAGRIYLVGGTTIVLEGLRAQTLDIDITFEIEAGASGEMYDAIRELKDSLDVNVEEESVPDISFHSRAATNHAPSLSGGTESSMSFTSTPIRRLSARSNGAR